MAGVAGDLQALPFGSLIGGPLLVALGPALVLYPFSACCRRMMPRKRVARTWATSSLVLAWLLDHGAGSSETPKGGHPGDEPWLVGAAACQ